MRLPLALALALPLTACSHPEPAADACPRPVERTFQGPSRTALDVLLVVSVSPSMCDERLQLEEHLRLLETRLSEAQPGFDLRVAATTTDLDCADAPGAQGRLNTVAATTVVEGCGGRVVRACTQDSDCEAAGEEGLWRCERHADDACITWSNGAIDSRCRRTCDSDEECREAWGDPRVICIHPGEASWSACVAPPPTHACPSQLPVYLSEENLHELPCIGAVNVREGGCYRSEQGLGAALAALEPGGPHADGFRRPDAYLLVLFLTDGDDCSVATGQALGDDELRGCAFGATTDDGGKLLPVAEVAGRLRALADDPAKVIVGVVGGDAAAEAEPDRAVAREAFRQAVLDDPCDGAPHICEGAGGVAGWSSRYLALAEAFGPNGGAANACDANAVAPVLDDIVGGGALTVTRLCLDREPEPLSLVLVKRFPDGAQLTLTAGDDYALLPGSAECGAGAALHLLDGPLEPGEELVVTYTPVCEQAPGS